MNNSLRARKRHVVAIITQCAPQLMGIFHEARNMGGWQQFSENMHDRRRLFRLDDYVVMYEDENRHGISLLLTYQSPADLVGLAEKLSSGGQEVQQQYIDELASQALLITEADFNAAFLPLFSDADSIAVRLENMSGEDQAKLFVQAQLFFGFFFTWFYNILSVMVHGEKLTSLVPKAITGDDAAFCKAVHVDKNLLHHHPAFRERYDRAQSFGEKAFLQRVGRNMATPPLSGKIRYPGLYLLFAMLESLRWLDDFKHEEILDLFEKTGMDQWQDGITDVNTVTKCLREYRLNQNKVAKSMH